MTNAPDPCPLCALNRVMVGYVHRCVPISRVRPGPIHLEVDDPKQAKAEKSRTVGAGARETKFSGVYAKRDPEKWKPYMANYMREYRARKRAANGQGQG